MEIVLDFGDRRSIRFSKEGGITSVGLKEPCPVCGQCDCYDHAGHKSHPNAGCETVEECQARQVSNAAIDGVESLLLSFTKAGIINLVRDNKAIVEAVEVTLDAIGNNLA